MHIKKIVGCIIGCLVMTGCNVKDGEQMDKERYGIPVQEYTGVEYPANEKKARWKYIEEHKQDIEARAIQWVKETFGLDVKINHLYPKNGAAIATAEWLNDANLKIKVVLGLDEKNERVSGVNPSMDAESNIMSYIVYKVYKEELDRLDAFLEDFCKKENLYGLTDEYIHNIGGFASVDKNYYYMSTFYLDYEKTYTTFLENPFISTEELKKIFEVEFEEDKKEKISKDQEYGTNLRVSLYSSTNEIDESLCKKLEKEFVKQTYLPDFNYSFSLNENTIDIRTNRSSYVSYPDAPSETGYIKIDRGNE